MALTFVIVNLCFVLFRADSFPNALLIYSRIFEFDCTLINWPSLADPLVNEYMVSLIITFPVFMLFEWLTRESDFNIFTVGLAKWKTVFSLLPAVASDLRFRCI